MTNTSSYKEVPLYNYNIPPDVRRKRIKDTCDAMFAGQDIFVKVTTEGVRNGSIARLKLKANAVVPSRVDFQMSQQQNSAFRSTSYFKYNRGYTKYEDYEENAYRTLIYNSVELHFDGRKNPIDTKNLDYDLLEGYAGPTVYVYDRSQSITAAVKEENMKDFMGNEVLVDHLVSIVDNNNMIVGTVTRYSTSRKSIFVKPIKVTENTYWKKEIVCSDSARLMLIDEELMNRLLIARLSN